MASKNPQPVSPVIEGAVEFVRKYAEEHEYFGSEPVCTAYKAAGLPYPEGRDSWRDLWAGVMVKAAKRGYIRKSKGRFVPVDGATHMGTTAKWMSNLYKGERTAIEAGVLEVDDLYRKWVSRQFNGNLREFLTKVYEIGFDHGKASDG